MAPGENPRPYMRIQLQMSEAGRTPETYSILLVPSDPVQGVTPLDLRNALQKLYQDARGGGIPWYPINNLYSELVTAIIILSERIKRYADGGASGGNLNIEREEWDGRRGRTYRIDIENLYGVNLRDPQSAPSI